jgi:multidrug efflux system membrane fusion protein
MRLSFANSFRLLALLLLAGAAACKKAGAPTEGRGGGGGVPVTVAEVVKRDVPVNLAAIGNVRASATVSVKPRVTGQVAAVEFTEGQNVKEDDVLLRLDPKPFEVALTQARAALGQVRAQADNAEQQARRYAELSKSGTVAKEQTDQLQAANKAAQANVAAAEAAVEEAQLQLDYCTIHAPIGGRVGRRVVDAGNVVTANVTDLAVINQLQPIEVVFSVPEQHLADIQRFMAQAPLAVEAHPYGRPEQRARGRLIFVDNTARPATGTIDVKASFPNEGFALWPGQFADVALTLTVQTGATVAPATAVQTGQKGAYAFVITPAQTAELRTVAVERVLENELVIRDGLAPGERVVVDGHLRLTPGTKVQIKPPVGDEQKAAQAAARPES